MCWRYEPEFHFAILPASHGFDPFGPGPCIRFHFRILFPAATRRVVPPGREALSETLYYSIPFNGVVRRYGIHIPSGLTEKSPALVILLHGRGGDESSMVRLTEGRFNQYAERYGYIVLYPSALGGHWEDGRTDQLFARDGKRREDMEYIAFLVKEMEALYSVDPNRIYIAGFSNGGMLALRLACEMPLPIRGVAAVAASLPVELESRCSVRPGLSPLPEAPVRLLLIHGTQDPVVPFQGGPIHGGEKVPRGRVLSVATTMDLFARRNGCIAAPGGWI